MRRQIVTTMYNNIILLDEIFVITRIIKVSEADIYIALTSASIMPDII